MDPTHVVFEPHPSISSSSNNNTNTNNNHGLRGSASPVLTATGFVNGRWQFSIPTESTPLDRSPKNLVQVITSAAPTAVPNLVQILRWGGGLLGKWVKYNEFFYLYLFFMNSPTGQTGRRIFTLDGSNDADSRKDVPLRGFVDIAPHFGGEIPRKPQILGRE